MKHFKRLFSYLVALTMVLSLAAFAGVSVHAEEKYTLTINNTSKGHELKMYQILTGDVYSDKILSNAKWGKGVLAIDGIRTKIVAGNSVSEADMTTLSKISDSEIANKITVNPDSVYQTQTVNDNADSVKFEDVVGGYYVVTDEAPNQTDNTKKRHTVTYSIVQVVGSIAINEKAGTIESEKKVEDVNDSTGDITDKGVNLLNDNKLGDSADYDFGDSINYTIEAKLPENYADYKVFPLTFVDTMSKGLTYNGNEKATLHLGNVEKGISELVTSTDITFTNGTAVKYNDSDKTADAHKYEWKIADLKKLNSDLKAGDIVYITYSATLNKDAVTGSEGNPNKMYIEYNNNPKSTQPETTNDQTPEDKNIVFTYEAVFNKVDQSGTPLTGADFTLYKFVKDDKKSVDTKTNLKGTWVDVTTLQNGDNKPTKTVNAYRNDKGSADAAKFSFRGIDDGYYMLKETKTPDGYNTIADQYFTITAGHDITSDDPQLTSLSGNALTGSVITLSADKNAGSLTTNVENKGGSTLPSTGGMGTTLLYAAGGILVACAAAYVIINRKKSAKK